VYSSHSHVPGTLTAIFTAQASPAKQRSVTQMLSADSVE